MCVCVCVCVCACVCAHVYGVVWRGPFVRCISVHACVRVRVCVCRRVAYVPREAARDETIVVQAG